MTRDHHLPERWLKIVDEVCARHRIHRRDLLSGHREKNIVACRFEAWWALRSAFGISLKTLGRRFGGYDHTSVLHGIRQHCARAGLKFERTQYKPHRDCEIDTVRVLFESGATDQDIVTGLYARHRRKMTVPALQQMRRKIGLAREPAVRVNGKFVSARAAA